MNSLAFALILNTAVLAAGDDSYTQAFKETHDTGKPLVVLVGADWCPGCRTMKSQVMPQVRQSGALTRVAYAQVNTDQTPQLARELISGGSIPQLVIFHQAADGWKRQVFVGARSASEVERSIDAAVDAAKVAGKLTAATR